MTRLGAWSQLPNAEALEALARSGADFVGIDAQHGAHGFRDVVDAIRLCDLIGVERLVRIQETELELIPRFLDFGADGVIVAMVADAEAARRAVALARYQPSGIRSYGGRRFGLSPEPDRLATVQPAVYAMLETAGALAALDEIAAVPGLAGIFAGPVDLGLALGLDGPLVRRLSEAVTEAASERPAAEAELLARWSAAIAAVVEVSHAANIEACTFAIGAGDAVHWAAAGFDRVVIGSDIALLRTALEREFRAARGTRSGA
jgi:4-hydroxy-2-oxoheptanedioate aldolase